jgi:hypothetical protein
MYGMRIVLIGRGRCGWHAKSVGEPDPHGHRYTTTGSSDGGTLDTYVREAPEGTPVYDASECDYSAFSSFVISGPMVKTSLPPGQIDRFSQQDQTAMTHMLPALGGEFNTLAKMNLAGLSSFDYVAVDVYMTLLQDKVPGVKVSKVVQGKVEWER